jgi:hypothetical protein
LKGLQNGDGSFGRSTNPSNALDTGLGIIAFRKKIFPLTKAFSDQNGETTVAINDLVKFRVRITNVGVVTATNIRVALVGLPEEWVLPSSQGSDLFLDEILPGQSREAEIFVRPQAGGNFSVFARIHAEQLSVPVTSNTVSFSVVEARLEAVLSLIS